MKKTAETGPPRQPPKSLLLVHGAGSGPWVFEGWDSAFPGVAVSAIDLQENLDVEKASMTSYAAVVTTAAQRLDPPVALCGWSMGGLTTLHVAPVVKPHSVILLEPSPPAEVQGFYPETPLMLGAFDPEEVYGPFAPGERSRPESLLARSERKRGISVPALPCPSLVVYGDTLPRNEAPAWPHSMGQRRHTFPVSAIGISCSSRESASLLPASWGSQVRWAAIASYFGQARPALPSPHSSQTARSSASART